MENRSNQFYCSECNQRTNSCLKGDFICAAHVSYIMAKITHDQEQREKEGRMTVGDCISLYGRLATLIILGEKEMAEKLKTIEPIINNYRDQWEAKGWTEEEIQDWINALPIDEQNKLRSMFDFYVKKVGAFLSEKGDELI